MKRIFTLLFALTSITYAFGQSIHILKGSTDLTGKELVVPITAGGEYEFFLSLENKTSSSVTFKVSRTILNGPMSSCASLLFCTGLNCYAANSSINWTAPGTATINGNQTLVDAAGITPHFTPCEDACKDMFVKYKIFNSAPGTVDTATIVIKYTCDANGIAEEAALGASLSDAYPNPATTDFSVGYHMNTFAKSEIVISDVLGKKVQQIKLSEKEGVVTVNASQLKEGIYFYALIVNNQVIATRKIIIRP